MFRVYCQKEGSDLIDILLLLNCFHLTLTINCQREGWELTDILVLLDLEDMTCNRSCTEFLYQRIFFNTICYLSKGKPRKVLLLLEIIAMAYLNSNIITNFIPHNARTVLITVCSNSQIEIGESFYYTVELQDQYSNRILVNFLFYYSINDNSIEYVTIVQGYALLQYTPYETGEHVINLYENPNLNDFGRIIVTCKRSLFININSLLQFKIIPIRQDLYYEVKKDPVLEIQFEITNTNGQVITFVNSQFSIALYGITETEKILITLNDHVKIIQNQIVHGLGIVKMRFLQVSSIIPSFQYFKLKFSLNNQLFEEYQPVYFSFYVRAKHRKIRF